MKKILLLIPIFLLASCNNPNGADKTTNNESTKDISTNNDPKTATNIPDSTEITWETTIHW